MAGLLPFSSWSTASPYAFALVVAALICALCTIVGLHRRALPGGLGAAVTMAAAAVWALFYAFELATPELDGKVIWAKAQYVGIAILPVAWYLAARSYTGATTKLSGSRIALLGLIPVITVALAATNESHGLVWNDVALDMSGPFRTLALQHGYWFWVCWTYSYALIALGSYLLLRGVYRYPGLYRQQTGLVMLAAAAPWLGNALYVAGAVPMETLDLTPFAFTISGLVLTLNMSRFRLFSLRPALIPLARDQLIAEMGDGVVVLDSHERVVTANPAAHLMLGLQGSDLRGRPAEELLGWETTGAMRAEDGDQEKRFEIVLGEGDHRRSYDVAASPVGRRSCPQDAEMGRLLVFRDITEQKKADEALQQSEERFRDLSSMATEGIMIHEDGIIADANRAFAELAGYESVDDLVGKRGTQVVPFTPESRRRIEDHMLSESTDTYEVELVRPDGSRLWAETSGREVTYRGRQARLVLLRNVTERKHGEHALRRSEERLRQSQKMESVGRLAGGVAHDFNNMLGVILGHADLAMRQVDPNDPVHEDLHEIREAAKRSAAITQQLLGFARKQVVAPAKLDLNTSVEPMLSMLRRLIGEDIELVWLPGDGLGSVEMDPSQLDQILMNLCANARDAIAAAGRVTIETAAAPLDASFCTLHEGCVPGDYVRLSVRDTGRGMQQETLEHVFEPFFTTKDIGEGTGLGMATVYGIVKQNGGYVEVASEPGLGTVVDIYLPRTEVEEIADGRAGVLASAPGSAEVVLLVEDEPSLLALSERILTGAGYRVLSAQTPVEALRLADEHAGEIALIVTDVIMPGMSGRELVERVLSVQPRVKTLYVSGYIAEVISDRGMLEEGVRFLQKPFTPQELTKSVRSTLDGRETVV